MTKLHGMAFCFLGKSGAGKGTQLELFLKELHRQKYSVLSITAGDLFRALKETKTLVGHRIKDVLNTGGLAPSWLAAFLWQRKLVEELTDQNTVIIFDGSPRKTEEAHTLDDVMQWLVRRAIVPVYLDITREEAVLRLKARGRHDDTALAIENRLSWFETDVRPIVEHYESQGRLIHIDGMGDPQEVFGRLRKAVNAIAE